LAAAAAETGLSQADVIRQSLSSRAGSDRAREDAALWRITSKD